MSVVLTELSDGDISGLSSHERRALMHRLAAAERATQRALPRVRVLRLWILAASALVLLPWLVFLAISLPDHYTASNWAVTWIGFDATLLLMLAATVLLALRRHRAVMLTAFATGVLLVCDAWFDVMTASVGDRRASLLSAAVVELPLAALLIVSTIRAERDGYRVGPLRQP